MRIVFDFAFMEYISMNGEKIQKRRTESSCNLLCFRDCNREYDNLPQNELLNKPDKISLKKVM